MSIYLIGLKLDNIFLAVPYESLAGSTDFFKTIFIYLLYMSVLSACTFAH